MYDVSASKSVIQSSLSSLREEGSGKIIFPIVCSIHALRSEESDTGNLWVDITLYFASILCRLFKSMCHLYVPYNKIGVFRKFRILDLKNAMKFSSLPTPSQKNI
jgi:hypothetical protein